MIFVLICFSNNTHNFVLSKFPTYEEAWNQMLAELKETDNHRYEEAYKEDADEKGYVEENSEYGISKNTAFANDCHDTDYDWAIVTVENENSYILVSLCENDREIVYGTFCTFELAKNNMIEDVISFDSGYFEDIYYDNLNKYGFVDEEQCVVEKDNAWVANDDTGCDWAVFNLAEI